MALPAELVTTEQLLEYFNALHDGSSCAACGNAKFNLQIMTDDKPALFAYHGTTLDSTTMQTTDNHSRIPYFLTSCAACGLIRTYHATTVATAISSKHPQGSDI